MRWVVIFDDHADREAIRKEYAQAHVDYLAAHGDAIVITGGLRPAPGASTPSPTIASAIRSGGIGRASPPRLRRLRVRAGPCLRP